MRVHEAWYKRWSKSNAGISGEIRIALGLRTLAIELICLLVVVDVDVAGGGGIGDCTGNPLSCSRNGRNIKDCGPDMLSWLFVIWACSSWMLCCMMCSCCRFKCSVCIRCISICFCESTVMCAGYDCKAMGRAIRGMMNHVVAGKKQRMKFPFHLCFLENERQRRARYARVFIFCFSVGTPRTRKCNVGKIVRFTGGLIFPGRTTIFPFIPFSS